MKKPVKDKKKLTVFKQNALTNLVLGMLLLSVATLCLSPIDATITTDSEEADVYRQGISKDGVSLMFNVYWGTDEVYQILDTLKKYDAKCTFFIGGCWADDNVECLKTIYSQGHELGNHGYFHKDQDKLSLEKNKEEIQSCNQFIRLATGYSPILFAPPSGAYNTNTLSACKSLQMKTILWSKDTIDWRDKDSNMIYKRATKNIKAGDFVLMHPMKETASALEKILQYYHQNALSVITVSENLQEKG